MDGAAELQEMSPGALCTAEAVGSWRCAEGPGVAAGRGGQRGGAGAPPHRRCSRDCSQGDPGNITPQVRDGRRGGGKCRSQKGDANKPKLNFLYTSGELVFKQRVPGFKLVFT